MLNTRTLMIVLAVAALAVAPAFIYPMLIVKLLCFAIFASAFNLMLGYTGLLSFGQPRCFIVRPSA